MKTRKQRHIEANRIADVAIMYGALFAIVEDRRSETTVLCVWDNPRLRASASLSTLHNGGVLMSWFDAGEKLVDGAWFDSVNPHHRMKATLYRGDVDRFLFAFTAACEAVADGRAFGRGT